MAKLDQILVCFAFNKNRYQMLDKLLNAGNVEIRVVPKERLFLHGKAGSIHYADGTRKALRHK